MKDSGRRSKNISRAKEGPNQDYDNRRIRILEHGGMLRQKEAEKAIPKKVSDDLDRAQASDRIKRFETRVRNKRNVKFRKPGV